MFKKQKPLNPKTPQWFRDWNWQSFQPIEKQSSRNERLIYIILAAILASSTFQHVDASVLLRNIISFIER